MTALAAMVAVLAFGAVGAGSASAFHPLFLNEGNKAELLFSGEGSLATTGVLPTLRALNAGILGTITCEKVLVDGFAENKSTLAHRVKVEFHGKCTLHSNATGLVACTETIKVNQSLAELGLVLGNKTVGILLASSEKAPEFVKVTCGSNITTVEGAVIGEIPEKVGTVEQYNKPLIETLQVFEAEGKSSENQNITSIELLGVNMTVGTTLKVSGFFGGAASEEASVTLTGDGKIEICTLAFQNCP